MAREPDTVKWLDDDRFVIANEGDYQGGARGFSIFHKDGSLLFESGASFEHEIIVPVTTQSLAPTDVVMSQRV